MKTPKVTWLFLLVTEIAMSSCRGLFFNHSATYNRNIQNQPYDAIIVPGVPFEDSSWSYIMKGRVLWSVYLYKQGYAKNIIYSGSAVYSPYIEGKIMSLYAEKLGVDTSHIFVEPRAEHSTENVYYGTLIARGRGFKRVGLATDRFQARTLADYLPKVKRKTGVRVLSLPMQEALMAAMPHNDPPIQFDKAAVENFVSIVQRQSKLKRLWGTLGKNIRYEKKRHKDVPPASQAPTN